MVRDLVRVLMKLNFNLLIRNPVCKWTPFTAETVFFTNLRTSENYSTTLKFGALPSVGIDHMTLYCLSSAGAYQRIVPVFGNFRSKFGVT